MGCSLLASRTQERAIQPFAASTGDTAGVSRHICQSVQISCAFAMKPLNRLAAVS